MPVVYKPKENLSSVRVTQEQIGQITIKWVYASNSTQIVYIVPSGKKLKLQILDLGLFSDAGALADGAIVEINGAEIMSAWVENTTSSAFNEVMTFNPPLILYAGDRITLTGNSVNITATCHAIGHLFLNSV